MSNLQAALDYARQGFPVFPLFHVLADGGCSCRPRAGHPCKRIGKHPVTKNGVQDATTDEARIRQWWTEMPHANIGLATGHNGLIVVDVDDGDLKKDGKVIGKKTGSESLAALIAQHGELPETRTVRTGGGGRHLYFYSTREITNSRDKVGKFIDVRGYGGYVILPPSNHESGGRYSVMVDAAIADMPEWLEKLCVDSRIDISDDTMQQEVLDSAKSRFTGDQLIRLLDYIPADCDRDTWWQVGAVLKKELGDRRGFKEWDAWSRKAPDKYDPKVMPVQWASFQTDKGLTAGTLHHFAKTWGNFRGFDIEAADSDEIKDNWCFVAGIKRFVELDALMEWDKEQFDAMNAPMFSRGKASDHVLRNPSFRRVRGATYWPEQPRWVNEYGLDKLNYWRPAEMTAARGNVTPFENHIAYLFPEGNEGKILRQYLAFQVQCPGEKVHWAVLLEGDQGNGKSYFATVMRLVLGPHNVKNVTNEALHETFTGWQRNTQLVVVEEMMAKGRLELMNKLKPMITEPWCMIREMYRPPYEQPNRFNFLFFSNHDNALILDKTDRRYCILKTNSPPHPEGNRYYGPLFDWTRRNGPALLHYLKHEVDLSDFQPKAHAPITAGKLAMIKNSQFPLDTTIQDAVESGAPPFHWDMVRLDLLIDPLVRKYRQQTNVKELSNAFHRLGYRQLDRRIDLCGVKCQPWFVRDADTYCAMTADQLRGVWLNQLNNDGLKQADEAVIDALARKDPQQRLLNDQEAM